MHFAGAEGKTKNIVGRNVEKSAADRHGRERQQRRLPSERLPSPGPGRCEHRSVSFRVRSNHIVSEYPHHVSRESHRQREMYIGHARLCVSVRGRMPILLHGPGRNFGSGSG